jgi:hypothetical protein
MTAPAAADGGDNGALGPASDVRLESGFPDPLNDVLNLFRSGAVGHVHNHEEILSSLSTKTKAAICDRGVGCEKL